MSTIDQRARQRTIVDNQPILQEGNGVSYRPKNEDGKKLMRKWESITLWITGVLPVIFLVVNLLVVLGLPMGDSYTRWGFTIESLFIALTVLMTWILCATKGITWVSLISCIFATVAFGFEVGQAIDLSVIAKCDNFMCADVDGQRLTQFTLLLIMGWVHAFTGLVYLVANVIVFINLFFRSRR